MSKPATGAVQWTANSATSVLDNEGQQTVGNDGDVSQWVAVNKWATFLHTVGQTNTATKATTYTNTNGHKALRTRVGSALRFTTTTHAEVPEVDLAGRTIFLVYRFAASSAPSELTPPMVTLMVRHATNHTVVVRLMQNRATGVVSLVHGSAEPVILGSPASDADLIVAGGLQVFALLCRGNTATLTWQQGSNTALVTTIFTTAEQRTLDIAGEYNDTTDVTTGSADLYLHELRFYPTQMTTEQQQQVCANLYAQWESS